MATTNGFQSIDELDKELRPSQYRHVTPQSYEELFAIDLSGAIAESKRISANTSDKAYRKLTAHANATSYSLLTNLHACPRMFELDKLQANAETPLDTGEVNVDFAFGHAVGAGIQTYAATGSLVAAQFAAFVAWKAPWDVEKVDGRGKVSKSLTIAMQAVEKFAHFWNQELSDYEVVRLPSGKPAVELAFAVDMENGYYHFGHIDTVLRHKRTGQLAVWEGKTTALQNIKPEAYGNSNQALGYSVVVDAIAQELAADGSDYEVLYIVFSSTSREFQLLPFGKSRAQRAEWLNDLILDHHSITTYKRIAFYPKRGESCLNQYGRTCYWYGRCGMSNQALFPGIEPPVLEDVADVESVDFFFTKTQLIESQRSKG